MKFSGNTLDKVFKAIQVYNNGYYSDKDRDEALDVLVAEFHDQLAEAWETEKLESGLEPSEVEHLRGTSEEAEWEIQHMIDALFPTNVF